MLIIEREPEPARHAGAVEDLEHRLGGLLNLPVADEAVDAAQVQIRGVLLRDPADAQRRAELSMGRCHAVPFASAPNESDRSVDVNE